MSSCRENGIAALFLAFSGFYQSMEWLETNGRGLLGILYKASRDHCLVKSSCSGGCYLNITLQQVMTQKSRGAYKVHNQGSFNDDGNSKRHFTFCFSPFSQQAFTSSVPNTSLVLRLSIYMVELTSHVCHQSLVVPLNGIVQYHTGLRKKQALVTAKLREVSKCSQFLPLH